MIERGRSGSGPVASPARHLQLPPEVGRIEDRDSLDSTQRKEIGVAELFKHLGTTQDVLDFSDDGFGGNRCGWRTRRGTWYPQCPSRTREPLPGGQVPRAPDRAGHPHERIPGAPGLGPLELVAHNLALGNAGLRRDLFQPSRKLLGKTNGDRMAHTQNCSRSRAPRQTRGRRTITPI